MCSSDLDSGKGQATLETVEDSEEDMEMDSPIKRVVEIVPTELFQYVGPLSKPGDSKKTKKANSQVRFNKTELTVDEAQTITKVWNSWSEPKRKSVVSGMDQIKAIQKLVQAAISATPK